MKKTLLATTILLLASAPVFAGGNGNGITGDNNHGQEVKDAINGTGAYVNKVPLGNLGGAVGGRGNSDGTTDGQAHDEDETRGEKMQGYHEGDGIGSN